MHVGLLAILAKSARRSMKPDIEYDFAQCGELFPLLLFKILLLLKIEQPGEHS